MSMHERYGIRDLTYSRWHRTLGDECAYIDLDGVEYCRKCLEPLALIETTRDVGQWKPTTVMGMMAEKSGMRAYLIMWTPEDSSPHGIGACRVFEVLGRRQRGKEIRMSLDELGAFIKRIHADCPCLKAGNGTTTTAASLLADLRRRGLSVHAESGRLVLSPASLLTDELRDSIREHKFAILNILA